VGILKLGGVERKEEEILECKVKKHLWGNSLVRIGIILQISL
jgi:hypothetical protein